MSDDQLREVREKAEAELRKREAARRAEACRKILELAEQHNINLAELASKPGTGNAYMNPENPWQKWSGRGRKPKWVQDWLASGRRLDELPRG